jgi:hypothetical protein
MRPIRQSISKAEGQRGKTLKKRAPPLAGLFQLIYQRWKKMRRQKSGSFAQRRHPRKRVSEGPRRGQTTWADPTVPITKVLRRGKVKLNKNQMKKNSFWWFG